MMPHMPTLLITGATRGLGLETAKAARARGAEVLCAGRDPAAVEAVARRLGAQPVVLDLARLADVRAVAAELPRVDAVACNAGVQILRGPTLTPDGFEATFQVNHLAHVALVDALLARPVAPRRIAFVGSATHDPEVWTGTPAPWEGPLAAVAGPADPADPADAAAPSRTDGLRRYATSKLLAVATAAALARERPDLHVTGFDPGLMPGTGLARQHPAPARLLWATVLRGLAVLPFASTPAASGRTLAALLCADPPPVASGAYVDARGRPLTPSRRARDPAYQDAVLRESRELLAAGLARSPARSR
jgi:NAD(P)-dependent dehydrogenase (short-subunit alcohol dehydrogenase family)